MILPTHYELDNIYNVDCCVALHEMQQSSIDLCFADPPFNIGYEYDQYQDSKITEEYLAFCDRWIHGCYRVLKPNGTFWLAIGDEYVAELNLICKQHGFYLRSWVIWYYTFGMHRVNNFTRSHTHLLYFVKDRNNFIFNIDDIKVKSARELIYNDSRAAPEGRLPDDTWLLRPQQYGELLRGLGDGGADTWYASRVAGTFRERLGWHPCQMPEKILERIVGACSDVGGIVADPMAGSGTTLVAAKRLGRRFIGFELSADYCAGIRERLANV